VYQVRRPGYSKRDPVQRWALPDRVFFACGACHILAYAFLERHDTAERQALAMQALWIRPATGFTGNHVVVAGRAPSGTEWIFDYHGYSERKAFLAHCRRRARQRWPGWEATLVPLPASVLVSERLSLGYPGLRLREPAQFLHDALPRARAYLDRFPPPGPGTP